MSQPPLNDDERADLVAYLDGELTEEAERTLEARLNREPALRAELESLKQTWDLLDFLPRPETSPSFTERTLSRLEPVAKSAPVPAGPKRRWRPAALGVGWAAAVLFAGWLGYGGYQVVVPREPGEPELVRELRLIENKRFYELVEEIEFLKQLDHPDLFGEEG